MRAGASVLSGGAKQLPPPQPVKGAEREPSPADPAGLWGRGGEERGKKRVRRENGNVCSEPCKAGVSNKPSRRDSRTRPETREQERVPGQRKPAATRGPIAKLFSNTVIATSIAVLFQKQIPKFYVHKGLDINKKEVRKAVCTV